MTQNHSPIPKLPAEENTDNPFSFKWLLIIGGVIVFFMLVMIGIFVVRTLVDTNQIKAEQVAEQPQTGEQKGDAQSNAGEQTGDGQNQVGNGEGADPDSNLPLVLPTGVEEGQDYIVLKSPEAKEKAPIVDVYLDYLCPFCGLFEEKAGDELQKLIDDGDVVVRLHMIPMLDNYSNPVGYSGRAANAAMCVHEQDSKLFPQMHRSLFTHQPHEGGPGLTDAQLAGLAREVGATPSTEKCIAEHKYTPWLRRVVRPTSLARVQGTPTVLINGSMYEGDWRVPGNLSAAIKNGN